MALGSVPREGRKRNLYTVAPRARPSRRRAPQGREPVEHGHLKLDQPLALLVQLRLVGAWPRNRLEGLPPRRRTAAIARLHFAHPPVIAKNRMPHAALVPHLLGRRMKILARLAAGRANPNLPRRRVTINPSRHRQSPLRHHLRQALALVTCRKPTLRAGAWPASQVR